ncbi:MAG: amylo-alpha-1,6-glucosidase [Anaerolineae bacterium]
MGETVTRDVVEEAREHAIDVLRRCASEAGFKASALKNGYPHIWARDSMITALGACVSGEPDLIQAFRDSLDTLRSHQSHRGLMPLNVHAETGEVSTENAGAVDANLWYILGHFAYYQLTGDRDYLMESWSSIQEALVWLCYQDMNECGLLEVPEAGDWMDLLAVRYNVLYDNVLYYAALRAVCMLAEIVGDDDIVADRTPEDVHARLNLLMWIERCLVPEHWAEQLERLKEMRLEWYMLYYNVGVISSRPFYLPYVAFREYGDYCDVLGNLLAILCGVADQERSERILRYLYQVGAGRPFPSVAIYPPIFPGQPEWREYYRSRNLNLPHQYHNGGIWPFIGGFHVAALVRMGWMEEAHNLLRDLAEANRLGVEEPWEFNEWLHGQTGNPMGYPYQAWSAGMYLYAYHAVESGELFLFDALTGDIEAKTDY